MTEFTLTKERNSITTTSLKLVKKYDSLVVLPIDCELDLLIVPIKKNKSIILGQL